MAVPPPDLAGCSRGVPVSGGVAASIELPAGVDTGIRFVTTDAEADHASMERQGVEVSEVLRWPGVPAMFSLRDLDGNTFYLAEPGLED